MSEEESRRGQNELTCGPREGVKLLKGAVELALIGR